MTENPLQHFERVNINFISFSGCDSGFGYGAALRLNKIGFKVFATCMFPNGDGAIGLLQKAEHPTKMIIIKMDITNDKDIEAAYETVTSYMTDSEVLFGLVNNAGIGLSAEFEWGSINDGKKVIEVNFIGVMKVTRQFLPLIRKAKGRILNIESVASLIPCAQAVFYGSSKCGTAGFSDSLRIGMYRFGVSVVSINPWIYKTPLSNSKTLVSQYESSFRNSSEEIRCAYGENFMKKGIAGLNSLYFSTKSNAVHNVVVSALTVYEPDPRYIVAPILLKPLLKWWLWLPKETLEVGYQIHTWLMGTHKAYPEKAIPTKPFTISIEKTEP